MAATKKSLDVLALYPEISQIGDVKLRRAVVGGKILYYVDQLDVIGIHKDRWKKHLLIAKAEI